MVEPATHTLLVGPRQRGWPVGPREPLTVWIGAAIGRRQKILYELEPAEDRNSVLTALRSWDAGDQMEVLEPAAVRAESSGTAEGLALMHRARVDEARAQGWSGLAVVTGPAVLAAVADGEDTATMHEHGVRRMVVEAGMSALCRYRPEAQPELADMMLAGHLDDVDDEIWGARVVAGVLYLRGEVDISNDDRVVRVLRGAIVDGVRELDLSGLSFCSAAGARVLASAADSVPAGETLVIANPDPTVLHLLAIVGLFDSPSIELRGQR